MSNGLTPGLDPIEATKFAVDYRRWKSDVVQHETLVKLVDDVQPPTHASTSDGAARNASYQKLAESTKRMREQLQVQDSLGGPGGSESLDLQLAAERARAAFYFFQVYDINELPNEILLNILRIATWSSPSMRRNWRTRKDLTHVCQRWRYLMIADTTLWTTIIFVNTPPHNMSFTCMERAGDAILDVRIDDVTRQEKFSPETLAALLDRLFVKLPYIRTMAASFVEWSSTQIILEKLRDAALAGTKINLRRLEIRRGMKPYIRMGHEAHEPVVSLFGGVACPSLKHFALDGTHIDWNNSVLANLTVLEVGRIMFDGAPDYSRFQSILAACPNLEKLALNGAGPALPTSHVPHGSGPLMENLKILVLGAFSPSYAWELVRSFRAPFVVDFSLLNFGGEDHTVLFEAITGLYPDMQILSIANFDALGSPEGRKITTKWALSVPRLRLLRVIHCATSFLDTFFDDPDDLFLTSDVPMPVEPIGKKRRVLCPKLEVLDSTHTSVAILLKWLHARRALRVPARKLYVGNKWGQSKENRPSVDSLQLVVPVLLHGPVAIPPEEVQIHTENGIMGALERPGD